MYVLTNVIYQKDAYKLLYAEVHTNCVERQVGNSVRENCVIHLNVHKYNTHKYKML